MAMKDTPAGLVPVPFKRSRAPENSVRNPDLRIVATLMQLAGHFNKHYSHPSQSKLLELLERFTGRKISRRHLCRHLNALEQQGYLSRQRRHTHDKRFGFVLKSTLYKIGGRYLAQLRNIVRGVKKFQDSFEKSIASIRVPRAAQNRESLLKILVGRSSYPQAGPP